jgi:hypothetical protein
MTTSKQCFKLFKRNPKEFLRRFVTVDETWIQHYMPEMKEESKQWTSPGKQAPKKAKTVPSARKVTATISWDSKGKNDHRAILWSIMGQIWRCIEGKMAPLGEEESAVPSSQCAGTPIPRCRTEIDEIGLRIVATSTVFSRFSPLRLLPVSQHDEMARWKKIRIEWEAHYQNWSLFLEGLKKWEIRWASVLS